MTEISKVENDYHYLGLIGELLSVATFRVEHMPSVTAALNFIVEERKAYELNNPIAEENKEEVSNEADSTDTRSEDTDHVSQS